MAYIKNYVMLLVVALCSTLLVGQVAAGCSEGSCSDGMDCDFASGECILAD